MIKYFGKIRAQLVNEGKTSRYFKYATGEIVLVVVGILIALQINTWNQNRLEKAKEHSYLTNIKRDLKHQLDSIAIHLTFEKKYIVNAEPLLSSFYKNDSLSLDASVMRNLSILTERKTFIRTDPTFKELIATGNIDLIQDNTFKSKLIIYYQDLERIEKVIQNNNTQLTDQNYNPKIMSLIAFSTKKRPSSPRLESISKRLLTHEENELLLVNLTNLRQIVAEGHLLLLVDLKKQTEALMDHVNSLL